MTNTATNTVLLPAADSLRQLNFHPTPPAAMLFRYVPLMVRHILIISTLIFLSCSTGTRQRDGISVDTTVTVDNTITKKVTKHNFGIHSTTKCEQTNLSNQFDIRIDFNRYLDTIELFDSCILRVEIKNKQTKLYADTIFLTSLFYSGNTFSNCDSSITSFITGVNSKRPFVDNNYGDLIISDFNFDKKDDIAIMNDCGGNGGPSYSYFIQADDCKFKLSSFLTDTVAYFPSTIDKLRQQLITYVHAGACCVGEHVYKFDKLKKTWRQAEYKLHRL